MALGKLIFVVDPYGKSKNSWTALTKGLPEVNFKAICSQI
jgi:hypothetical protein